MYRKIIFYFALISFFHISAQDGLLKELEKDEQDIPSYAPPTFKTLKIGNLQSTKVVEKGDLFLIVSHRFGPLSEGFKTFFGLDNANTKIELLYSFWEGIQLSISRESFDRTLAVTSKISIATQEESFPVNLTGFLGFYRNTLVNTLTFPELKDADRNSFSMQLLASRRFSKSFSFEIAPTYIRENLQNLHDTIEANHNQFALGFGGRCKLSKRVSLNGEYVYNFNRHKNSRFYNPYAFGVDIETGGHVFQLLLTNAQSTNEPGFISKAEGSLVFGFNIVRVF